MGGQSNFWYSENRTSQTGSAALFLLLKKFFYQVCLQYSSIINHLIIQKPRVSFVFKKAHHKYKNTQTSNTTRAM